MTQAHRAVLGGVALALGLAIGAGVANAGPATVATASGPLTPNPAFQHDGLLDTPADDLTNPALGAEGRVHFTIAVADGNRTNATFHVSGLPARRTFGAHLHRDPCTATFGGPHYQHPTGTPVAGVTPTRANELWLDVTTNAAGRGSTAVSVPFPVLAAMRSVVVHQLPTNDTTLPGNAGQRIGCLPLAV